MRLSTLNCFVYSCKGYVAPKLDPLLSFQERNVLILTFNFMSVGQTTVSEERTTDEVQARDILLELTYQSNILHGHIITLHTLSRWLKFIVEYNSD